MLECLQELKQTHNLNHKILQRKNIYFVWKIPWIFQNGNQADSDLYILIGLIKTPKIMNCSQINWIQTVLEALPVLGYCLIFSMLSDEDQNQSIQIKTIKCVCFNNLIQNHCYCKFWLIICTRAVDIINCLCLLQLQDLTQINYLLVNRKNIKLLQFTISFKQVDTHFFDYFN